MSAGSHVLCGWKSTTEPRGFRRTHKEENPSSKFTPQYILLLREEKLEVWKATLHFWDYSRIAQLQLSPPYPLYFIFFSGTHHYTVQQQVAHDRISPAEGCSTWTLSSLESIPRKEAPRKEAHVPNSYAGQATVPPLRIILPPRHK